VQQILFANVKEVFMPKFRSRRVFGVILFALVPFALAVEKPWRRRLLAGKSSPGISE